MANTRILHSFDTESNWNTINPTIKRGEIIFKQKASGRIAMAVGNSDRGVAAMDAPVVYDEDVVLGHIDEIENTKEAAISTINDSVANVQADIETAVESCNNDKLECENIKEDVNSIAEKMGNPISDIDYKEGKLEVQKADGSSENISLKSLYATPLVSETDLDEVTDEGKYSASDEVASETVNTPSKSAFYLEVVKNAEGDIVQTLTVLGEKPAVYTRGYTSEWSGWAKSASESFINDTVNEFAASLPPNPIRMRNIAISGTQVSLKWAEPLDIFIEGNVFSEWEKTVIVKKQGSYPSSIADGKVVIENTVRDKYKDEALVDTQENASEWFYRAFPKSKGGSYSLSELNKFGFWHYAVYIDTGDLDEASCVHDVEGYDNYFLDKCFMDFTLDKFNWGGWENAMFLPKPCMLNSNGTVAYYLNPDDYTKKADGGDSDVTNTEFDGNAMLEWSPIYTKAEKRGDRLYLYFCSEKIADGYECWSAKKSDGAYAEHFYLPIYEGVNIDSKLRSMSTGTKPTASLNAETEATYAMANGEGWNTTVWADEDLLRMLGILMFKRLNLQVALGYSCGSSSSALTHVTGTANQKGMFYGQESTSAYATKYFGAENWYGHRWRRCNGLMCIGLRYWVKMTHSKIDGSTVEGYNRTGEGYVDTGINCPSASSSYIRSIAGTDKLVTAPTNVSGASSTTGFCDAAWSASGTTQLLCGGSVHNSVSAGLFAWDVNNAPSYALWYYGASVSYKNF